MVLAMTRGPAKPIMAPGSARMTSPKHGEAGGYAGSRGVGGDHDVEAAAFVQLGQGGRGLGHLNQRDHALLHAGSAGGGDHHQGQVLLRG